MSEKVNLDYQLFLQKEDQFFHQPYDNEITFYNAIRQGNIEYIEEIKRKYGTNKNDKTPDQNNGKGILSKNPIKNERYHLIVNAALITRTCIEGGLPQEDAYTLSDLYIRLADEAGSIPALKKINDEMVQEFTLQMRKLRTRRVVSKHIIQCINYIYNHLHEPLTIEILSKEIGLNPCYLSTLFKKETDMTIHAFIHAKKLETAKNMLKNSNYSCSDIATTLCFSSQSHFIRSFRQKYGMTPNEYRHR